MSPAPAGGAGDRAAPGGGWRAVWFEGPRRVRVRPVPAAAPGPGEALVRTRLSAISTGTELAAYRGRLDPDLPRDETLGALREGSFRFPFPYGYASLGVVDSVAESVVSPPPPGSPGPGDRVFAFVPHKSAFVAPLGDLLRPPPGLPDERAVLFPYLETAVNLLLDGRPLVGERVVVFGQGALGLALTALLSQLPLDRLVTVEPAADRRARSLEFGADAAVSPGDFAEGSGDGSRDGAESAATAVREHCPEGADLVFEVSGSGAALDGALRSVAPEGRIVVGSWLAGGPTALDLGGFFHRGRVRIVSSQVSRLPPLGPAWTVARRRATAWKLLRDTPLERLVTLRTPLERAGEAYEALDRGAALVALLVGSASGSESGSEFRPD